MKHAKLPRSKFPSLLPVTTFSTPSHAHLFVQCWAVSLQKLRGSLTQAALGAFVVSCQLGQPLLARAVFSAFRKVFLASSSRPPQCSFDILRLLRRRRFASHCFLLPFHLFLAGFHLIQHSHLDIPWRLLFDEFCFRRLSLASNFAICAVISMFRRRYVTALVKRSTLSPSRHIRHIKDSQTLV